MNYKTLGAGIASFATLTVAGAASAAVIDLNFEGIATAYPFANNILIQNYYNGGMASNGAVGPNDGVVFSSNALLLCMNSTTVTCSNTSRGGLAPGSDRGALFFLTGASTIMDVAAGFKNGFSFNYSDVNTLGASVSVYDGLGGTGTLLATFTLGLTPSGCPGYFGAYCPFQPIGVAFAGTAKSVVFGGVANHVVFDDVTFGSSRPGVPEPAAWALMLMGVGAVGAGLRTRRRAVLA